MRGQINPIYKKKPTQPSIQHQYYQTDCKQARLKRKIQIFNSEKCQRQSQISSTESSMMKHFSTHSSYHHTSINKAQVNPQNQEYLQPKRKFKHTQVQGSIKKSKKTVLKIHELSMLEKSQNLITKRKDSKKIKHSNDINKTQTKFLKKAKLQYRPFKIQKVTINSPLKKQLLKQQAATVIQSNFRGYLTRKYIRIAIQHKAAVVIQQFWRKYSKLKRLKCIILSRKTSIQQQQSIDSLQVIEHQQNRYHMLVEQQTQNIQGLIPILLSDSSINERIKRQILWVSSQIQSQQSQQKNNIEIKRSSFINGSNDQMVLIDRQFDELELETLILNIHRLYESQINIIFAKKHTAKAHARQLYLENLEELSFSNKIKIINEQYKQQVQLLNSKVNNILSGYIKRYSLKEHKSLDFSNEYLAPYEQTTPISKHTSLYKYDNSQNSQINCLQSYLTPQDNTHLQFDSGSEQIKANYILFYRFLKDFSFEDKIQSYIQSFTNPSILSQLMASTELVSRYDSFYLSLNKLELFSPQIIQQFMIFRSERESLNRLQMYFVLMLIDAMNQTFFSTLVTQSKSKIKRKHKNVETYYVSVVKQALILNNQRISEDNAIHDENVCNKFFSIFQTQQHLDLYQSKIKEQISGFIINEIIFQEFIALWTVLDHHEQSQ